MRVLGCAEWVHLDLVVIGHQGKTGGIGRSHLILLDTPKLRSFEGSEDVV